MGLKNTFTYHPPVNNQAKRYEVIREKALEFAVIITSLTPKSKERTEAIKKIRECVMWANSAIALNEKFKNLKDVVKQQTGGN